MPARDRFHESCKNALIKDGWTITDDPLRLQWGGKDTYVDLGAHKFFAAEKGDKKIAVEVKSFLGQSEMHDLEVALGQFILYSGIMQNTHPDRMLYLAVRTDTWDEVFEEPVGK